MDERNECLHRLGILNVFDPLYVDRQFKLDLRRWEHREWCKGTINIYDVALRDVISFYVTPSYIIHLIPALLSPSCTTLLFLLLPVLFLFVLLLIIHRLNYSKAL